MEDPGFFLKTNIWVKQNETKQTHIPKHASQFTGKNVQEFSSVFKNHYIFMRVEAEVLFLYVALLCCTKLLLRIKRMVSGKCKEKHFHTKHILYTWEIHLSSKTTLLNPLVLTLKFSSQMSCKQNCRRGSTCDLNLLLF